MDKKKFFEATLRVSSWRRDLIIVYENKDHLVEKERLWFEGELSSSLRPALKSATFTLSATKQFGSPKRDPSVELRCDPQGRIQSLMGFFWDLSPASFYGLYRNFVKAQGSGASGIFTLQGEELRIADLELPVRVTSISFGIKYPVGERSRSQL